MEPYQIILIILGCVIFTAGVIFLLCYRLVSKLFESAIGRISDEELEKSAKSFDDKIISGPLADKILLIHQGKAWQEAFSKKEISVISKDGLRLVGSLFERPEDDSAAAGKPGYGKTLLLCHGYHSSSPHDFSCALEFYYSLGFRLVLIDQRAHGRSEGTYLTFGAKEQYDVLSWCRWINATYGEQHDIVITGISMGATTVLLAASQPELPKNVIGVLADCGYSDAERELSHVIRDFMHLPTFPILQILRWMCRRRAGFDLNDCSAVERMPNVKIPVLFIHGEADDFVPVEHTRRNVSACSCRHTEHYVKGAGHGLSYLVNPSYSQKLICEFITSLKSST